MKTKSDHPALSTWIRMLKVHNLILRQARLRMAEHCTMAQFDVLAQLSRNNRGTTLAELSRHLLVTAGNVTGLIDRMEEAGFVKRTPDPEDRRSTRVLLTGKGKKLAGTVIPRHSRDIRDSFRSLHKNEILQLRRVLDKMIQALDQGDKQE